MKLLVKREQKVNKSQDQIKMMSINKKLKKKFGPRVTRSIKETVESAQVIQPNAGRRRLPRQNRRNKLIRRQELRRKI